MTTDIKQALLNADKTYRTIDGETRKLHCCEVNGRFFCDAEIMDPKTDEDRKFCLMDLWRSESDKAARFLAAFAKLGGYEDSWTAMHMPKLDPLTNLAGGVRPSSSCVGSLQRDSGASRQQSNPNAGVTQPYPKGRWT